MANTDKKHDDRTEERRIQPVLAICPNCGCKLQMGYCSPCQDEEAAYHEAMIAQQYIYHFLR